MLPFYIHDFLNSAPVIFPIEQKKIKGEITLLYHSPSEILRKFYEEPTFSGVVPSIALLHSPPVHFLDSFCISSEGMVETVCLYTTKDLNNIDTIYLDGRSRTSHSMLKIILLFLGLKKNMYTTSLI